MSVLELYCEVDDFYQGFAKYWKKHLLETGAVQRQREGKLSISEMMTIMIHFHQSHYRDFKAYYQKHVQVHLGSEFPDLVSYSRFVRLMPRVLVPLIVYLRTCQGKCSGISFVDSTRWRVCHNRRIKRHKVFSGLAARGKTSMGWFYGFKVHWVVNGQGEILTFQLTPGNIDDRKPVP